MRGLETIIRDHPLFKDLRDATIKYIAECGTNVVFEAGTVIAREGEEANAFYLIRDGKVAIQVSTPNQGPVTLQTVGANDIIGWSWLFPPYLWCYDIKAIKKTRVIALDGRCLRNKCEKDHDLGYRLMKRFSQLIAHRLQATRMQVLDVYNPSARS